MAKASARTTPSFVCELALVVSPESEGVLLSRLEAARQLYNACLSEAMKRVRLIRQSKDFGQLIKDWQSAELRLQAAWRKATVVQLATGGVLPSSCRAKTRARFANGRCPEVERVAVKVFATASKNQNVVAAMRESGRGCPVKEPPTFNESNALSALD